MKILTSHNDFILQFVWMPCQYHFANQLFKYDNYYSEKPVYTTPSLFFESKASPHCWNLHKPGPVPSRSEFPVSKCTIMKAAQITWLIRTGKVNTGCSAGKTALIQRSLSMTPDIWDVIVVGAGLSGLTAAHWLRKRNAKLKILILEGKGLCS